MFKLIRTDAQQKDFIDLVRDLDAYLTIQDGDEHDFYDQYNKLDQINHVVIVYYNDKAVGCGAIKAFEPSVMEVKRMYVVPEVRGKGVGAMILKELEAWASELSFKKCILETGKRQPEAIQLYQKNGYRTIPNYGQYRGVENSVCFEKYVSKDH